MIIPQPDMHSIRHTMNLVILQTKNIAVSCGEGTGMTRTGCVLIGAAAGLPTLVNSPPNKVCERHGVCHPMLARAEVRIERHCQIAVI